jgi:predicted permease
MTVRKANTDPDSRFDKSLLHRPDAGGSSVTSLVQDVRYALRQFHKSPGFAVVAVLTLTLGIGPNTAIFSVVNAVLFKPLSVKAPKELVNVYTSRPGGPLEYGPVSYPDYEDFRDQTKTLTGLMGFGTTNQVLLDHESQRQLISAELVTGNYFDVLGVTFAQGRMFDESQDREPSADPVAVISYATWQRNFGADPHIIGKPIRINGNILTIIGVAPRDFHGLWFGISPEVWIPLGMNSALHLGNPLNERGAYWLFVTGRLKPGVAIGEAEAEFKTIAARLAKAYPSTNKELDTKLLPANRVRTVPSADKILYPASLALLGFVGLILLIACANLAGMFLGRASVRSREMALRMALGAGRFRLIRQMLTESLVLSLLGGAFALCLTIFLNAVLFRALESSQFAIGLTLDVRVLGFTLAVVALTTILFGLAPALNATSVTLASPLKDEAGTTTASRKKHRALNALVVGQLAISLILLICAGLSLRSMWNAFRVNPGFDPTGVATVSFSPSLLAYSPIQATIFYQQLAERVRALPSVGSVGFAGTLPLTLNIAFSSCAPQGKDSLPDKEWLVVDNSQVGPGYFQTMGIPLLLGRQFTEQDTITSTPVVIVNQTLAHLFWPGQDAIGKRLRFSREGKYYEVVGVAHDGKYRTLADQERPYFYESLEQNSAANQILLARTVGNPRTLIGSISQIARQLDSNIPLTDAETLEEKTSVSLLLPRVASILFSLFGLFGFLLAAVGLYGVIACGVSQRTREIGVRIALGAAPLDIWRLVMARGISLVLIGVIAGLVGALAVTRGLSVIFYGVSATDPITFAGAVIFLILVAMVACYVPARKAMRVDPMVALRYE